MAKKAQISFSVADIPLGIALEEYFLLARHLDVDGIELVLGWKTRFAFKKIKRLSNRYNMPILSIHQPPWSMIGVYKDEKAFYFAKYFDAVYNAHPIAVHPMNSKRAHAYYKWLVEMREKYKVEILIENMTNTYQLMPLLHYVSRKHHDSATNLNFFEKICGQYDFGFTLDTSHLMRKKPQDHKGFQKIYPRMRNIHLSDYTKKKEHLGLGDGVIDSKSFLTFLKKEKYDGIINLELCPRVLNAREKYYKDIIESVKVVKKHLGR